MPYPKGELAWITPISGWPGLPGSPEQGLPGTPEQGLPGTPEHPIVLPPLPPGVPDQGLPPVSGTPEYPIEIPSTPEHPINLPPGTVWPPFNPSDGLQGKVLLLVWVPGVNKHKWVVIEVPETLPPMPTPPPRPQPK